MHKENAHHTCEKYFGFKEIENHHVAKVSMVEPYSPAWKAGLFINDEIIAVNGMVLNNNLSHWLHYFLDDEIILTVSSNEKLNMNQNYWNNVRYNNNCYPCYPYQYPNSYYPYYQNENHHQNYNPINQNYYESYPNNNYYNSINFNLIKDI